MKLKLAIAFIICAGSAFSQSPVPWSPVPFNSTIHYISKDSVIFTLKMDSIGSLNGQEIYYLWKQQFSIDLEQDFCDSSLSYNAHDLSNLPFHFYQLDTVIKLGAQDTMYVPLHAELSEIVEFGSEYSVVKVLEGVDSIYGAIDSIMEFEIKFSSAQTTNSKLTISKNHGLLAFPNRKAIPFMNYYYSHAGTGSFRQIGFINQNEQHGFDSPSLYAYHNRHPQDKFFYRKTSERVEYFGNYGNDKRSKCYAQYVVDQVEPDSSGYGGTIMHYDASMVPSSETCLFYESTDYLMPSGLENEKIVTGLVSKDSYGGIQRPVLYYRNGELLLENLVGYHQPCIDLWPIERSILYSQETGVRSIRTIHAWDGGTSWDSSELTLLGAFTGNGNYGNWPTGLGTDHKAVGKDLSIYPNPNQGAFSIESESPIEFVEIFDSMGRRVLTSTKSTISDEQLQSGWYFVHIHTDNGVHIQKMVVGN